VGPFEVLIVIVIVMTMTMFNDDNLLVVMALHIAIVVAVFLNNNRILSARRRYWQDKRHRRERCNCQSNITHRSLLVVNGVGEVVRAKGTIGEKPKHKLSH
jgi:hypothetical protein